MAGLVKVKALTFGLVAHKEGHYLIKAIFEELNMLAADGSVPNYRIDSKQLYADNPDLVIMHDDDKLTYRRYTGKEPSEMTIEFLILPPVAEEAKLDV